MGMDVYGREPRSKYGEYFRASISTWVPIHKALCVHCADVLTPEQLYFLSFNDGEGAHDQSSCDIIADRFEVLLATTPEEFIVESDERVDANGRCLSDSEVERIGFENTYSPYVTPASHVRAWIKFLRSCGGFKVF